MRREACVIRGLVAIVLLFSLCVSVFMHPLLAYANTPEFGMTDYEKYQKGSNREIDNTYYGYTYLIGKETQELVRVVAIDNACTIYIPKSVSERYGLNVSESDFVEILKSKLISFDDQNSETTTKLSEVKDFSITQDESYKLNGYNIDFNKTIKDNSYIVVNNPRNANDTYSALKFCITCKISTDASAMAGVDNSFWTGMSKFFETLDWSPLWVSLKTTAVSILIIFVLGLYTAYKALSINSKARSILDSIFTIPMVLPPTVCGFVLLFLCGRNTGFGRFFIDIGFPLIFSWPATVIACVVVAFPLMYKNALGAFESLDPNLLNAARTLGWSNFKIFTRLMMPLSRNSIAAATVLAYARALGEFGATLFLAGNYVGVTRTIPIAIYFEWMNGNNETAWFWTAIVIVVSFIVILTINIMNYRSEKNKQ